MKTTYCPKCKYPIDIYFSVGLASGDFQGVDIFCHSCEYQRQIDTVELSQLILTYIS